MGLVLRVTELDTTAVTGHAATAVERGGPSRIPRGLHFHLAPLPHL